MRLLDTTIFDDAGLGVLTPEEKERMLAYVQKTLETRVGIRLAEEADEAQLRTFTELADAGDDEAVYAWLATFPQLEAIARTELSDIKAELAFMAPEVLGARDN